MGFLKNLFGGSPQPWPPPGPITTWPVSDKFDLQGDAFIFDRSLDRRVEVVGESYRQPGIEQVAGGRTRDGAKVADHTALLLPEPTNPDDPNAVRVFVIPSQGGTAMLAGYLTKGTDSIDYRPVIDRLAAMGRLTMCHASLQGGWDRHISFGVVLWIESPWRLMADIDAAPARTRATRPTPPSVTTASRTTGRTARRAVLPWTRCRRRRRSARRAASRSMSEPARTMCATCSLKATWRLWKPAGRKP